MHKNTLRNSPRTTLIVRHDTITNQLVERLTDTSVAIFLFHGVIEKQTHPIRNYTSKHILKDDFTSYISALSQHGTPISMDQILDHHQRAKALPPRSFAITFDDGFENNLEVAAPILTDYGVPATIYVSSGFIEQNSMSWVDRIECAVELTECTEYFSPWLRSKMSLRTTPERISLLNAVRKYVKNTSSCNPHLFADEIMAELGISPITTSTDPLDQKLTWGQVQSLHEHELFTIGGHSHTHSILSFLSPPELAIELDTSIHLMQARTDITPIHYSYPEGLSHCYSETVIDELKARGILCCPTAIDGVNHVQDDLFHLRRVMVG